MNDGERCRLPDDISYEAWVNYVFDHPVLDPQWWWRREEMELYQEWNECAQPARTLGFLTRLFEDPSALRSRFTRAQINQGLTLLGDISCSSHMFVLRNRLLPWADRRRGLEAMVRWYSELMAPVYGDDLGHNEAEPGDPERPTYACYMWWDVNGLHGEVGDKDGDRINEAVLGVFEQVLTMREESCLESVLHGLGHWHYLFPDRVAAIVRAFLTRTDLSPALRRYAEYAAAGEVQ